MFNYKEAKKKDLINFLTPLFKKGTVYIRPDDHKLGMRTGMMWNTPWVYAGDRIADQTTNCILFQSIVLKYFNYIPARCQECWKVVARPQTVSQLFEVCDFQQTSDRPSKCGIELRDGTSALYGAYWYNKSVEEGFECKAYVERAMAEISSDIGVILKRGCTEFERKFGPSIDWRVLDDQPEMEQYLQDHLVIEDHSDFRQPEMLTDNVKCRWLEFAFEHGDKTYLEFTDQAPMFPELVTYHLPEVKDGV